MGIIFNARTMNGGVLFYFFYFVAYWLQIYPMEFPVGLGHMAGYLKGPQFPGHGPAALAGPFGLSHLDHSPYGGKFRSPPPTADSFPMFACWVPLRLFFTQQVRYTPYVDSAAPFSAGDVFTPRQWFPFIVTRLVAVIKLDQWRSGATANF